MADIAKGDLVVKVDINNPEHLPLRVYEYTGSSNSGEYRFHVKDSKGFAYSFKNIRLADSHEIDVALNKVKSKDSQYQIKAGDLVVLGDDCRNKRAPAKVYKLTKIDTSRDTLVFVVEDDIGREFLLISVRLATEDEIFNGWSGEAKGQDTDYENRNTYMEQLPKGMTEIDVYGVLDLFGVKHHQTGQAIKKLLCPGERGSKGEIQDLQEAIKLIKQAIIKLEREA